MATSRSLEAVRTEIDETDRKICALLNRRARLALEVGEAKASSGKSAFYAPEREQEVVERLRADNEGPFPDESIRPVFQEIISACLSLQVGLRVAFLGPESTFTELAVRMRFGSAAEGVACASIPAVFDAVARGSCHYGVVPVENSTEGVVTHTLDCFIDSDLAIVAEVFVPIEHCLLVQRGTSMADVTRVYSHPQALGQCRRWLRSNMPNAVLVDSASTAEAARAAAVTRNSAAIASELAARAYRLDSLHTGIQDLADNRTRFFVLAREQTESSGGTGTDKTTLMLAFEDGAGALYRILKPISAGGVNMTRIESRPSRKEAWQYVFFIDIDGHRDEPRVAQVLDNLGKECSLVSVLGSYRRDQNTESGS